MRTQSMTICRVVAALAAWGTLESAAPAQDTEIEQRLTEAISAAGPLTDLIRQWNSGDIELKRDAYTAMFRDDLANSPLSENLRANRLQQWQRLPAQLEPSRPLSPGATLVLLGLFEDNREQFAEQSGGGETAAVILASKLYFVLSIAQDSAAQRESETISSIDIFAGLQQGWCGIWPFCLRSPRPQ